MEFVRTPDDRFSDLDGYPFRPNYLNVASGDGGELRVHYLDEGPKDGDVVLLLHGEPSWSYLYRKMIPILTDAGFRCIAPDLIGFGRSDKPTDRGDYTYARHVEWLREVLFDHLDLSNITLFCQDWGGLLGLRLVADHGDHFRAVLASNTSLPTGEVEVPEAFHMWLDMSQNSPDFDIGGFLQFASSTQLTNAEVDAYRAPFPDDSFQAGARVFPALVPITKDQAGAEENRSAWKALSQFDSPFLTIFGADDMITSGAERAMISRIPGATNQPHKVVDGAGHFIQEDVPDELAGAIIALIS